MAAGAATRARTGFVLVAVLYFIDAAGTAAGAATGTATRAATGARTGFILVAVLYFIDTAGTAARAAAGAGFYFFVVFVFRGAATTAFAF